MDYLRGIGSDVTEVGTEQVRGDETTHYKGTVDLEEAAAAAPAESRKALEKALAQTGSSTVPVEVWVDEQGRTRRVLTTIALPDGLPGAAAPAPSASAGAGSVAATIEFYDFGVAADIAAPPAGEVTDLTSQLDQGGGSSAAPSAGTA